MQIDRSRSIPVQIVEDIRSRITDSRLAPGDPLPSTRVLARELGISRGSVVSAYEQLTGEGLLVAGPGGTRVDPSLRVPTAPTAGPEPGVRSAPLQGDLRPGAPAAGPLTTALWRSAWRAAAARPTAHPPLGSERLRTLIAEHVRLTRSIRVDPRDVVVTSGARDGLRLILAAHGRPGRLAVEDPGYHSLRQVPRAMGWRLQPVDADAAGMSARPAAVPADVLLVTPNHQFPTGTQMPASRRFALLEAASRAGALVVEDDYDSELRSTHPPLLALDSEGRVAMLGSFSKTLTPALALGYLIVPPSLRERVADLCLPVSGLVQDAVARYIEAGGLRRHTARMRREYRARRAAFVDLFPEGVPMEGGLHAVIPLPAGADEDRVVARCRRRGLAVEGMAGYWSARRPRASGVVLGLGTGSLERLRERLAVLRRAIDSADGG